MNFIQFNFSESTQKAIATIGYESPTRIQEKSIPVIAQGKDIIACAQTGTGKTAAFLLPLIEQLLKTKRNKYCTYTVVLVPTRELAIQVSDTLKQLTKFNQITGTVVYGGTPIQKQIRIINDGVNVIIATPGRLLDLVQRKVVALKHIQHLVLDEADLMLDLGFSKDIQRLISYMPKEKQTLLFSATMPKSIKQFAQGILKSPVSIEAHTVSSTAAKVLQQVVHIPQAQKSKLLADMVQKEDEQQMIVFTRTKRSADKLVKYLTLTGIKAAALHGDKSQSVRERTLSSFKNNKLKLLVATDIASRGIDIQDLPMVINFDIPLHAEAYVHRIGRTGRAGKEGTAISFCDASEKGQLKGIQQLIGFNIPTIKSEILA